MNSLIERNHSIKTMIFVVKFNLCFSPEINVSNIFNEFFFYINDQLWHNMAFLSFLIITLFCGMRCPVGDRSIQV